MLLKGKNIFIVEDNAQNRVIYQTVLMTQGATLEFDRWGRQAEMHLQCFKHFDLIILDLMLPGGITGYDVFKRIRELPGFENVPVVAISAADPSAAIKETREKGFSGFIAKPIDMILLPGQLARIIEGEQVWYGGEHFVTA